MPFSEAKFTEMYTALQAALGNQNLPYAERHYLKNLQFQFDTQGNRLTLNERELSMIEDLLAPYASTQTQQIMPKKRLDPFKRYATHTYPVADPASEFSLRSISLAITALAVLVSSYSML